MINPSHYQEWLDSAIAPDLIELNLESIDGSMWENSPIEKLCYAVERNKTNAFGGFPKEKIDRYAHTTAGGWWCSGIDILGGGGSDWGCFKPDTPYTYTEVSKGFDPDTSTKKTKTIKYEHPVKVKTEAFFLRVSDRLWQEIADRHDVAPYCLLPNLTDPPPLKSIDLSSEGWIENPYSQFWLWVLTANLPITITEGVKKAAAVLSTGKIAVAIPGINSGYRQPRDEFKKKSGLPYLLPQLQPFATKEREINICFDNDTDPNWKKAIEKKINVRRAIEKLGSFFNKSRCNVNVITWDTSDKGIDDLIKSKGQDYFEGVFKSRLSLSDYKINGFLTLYPDLTINERYIPETLQYSEHAKLIGLKALHGTGKTEYLSKKITAYLNKGQKVIIIVHREQLARELAKRFGIEYRTELFESEHSGLFGYALCIDSLHPNAKPAFKPEDWEDSIIVIDEVEQVLWHLLDGGTCREKRVKILKTFKTLLQTVACSELGKIFIADADLSPITINYIEQLIGFKVPKFIVKNSYVPRLNRKLYYFTGNDPSQVILKLEANLQRGQKAIVHTDGRKHQSKWGTRNIEAWVKKNFPDLKVLRIDRQSVGDKDHPAFGCVDNLNQILPDYDVVICSPVIETGVSINVNHFDGVYALSHGVQNVDSVVQTLQRVRSDIPRYIWCKKFSASRIGNGSTDIKSLLSSTHKVATAQIGLLQKMGISEASEISFYEEDPDLKGCSPSLLAWAKLAVIINSQAPNFAVSVLKKCEGLGYQLIDNSNDLEDCSGTDIIKEEINQTRDENYNKHCYEVSQKPNITNSEYEKLKEQRGLTESESDTLKKAEISRLYTTDDVDIELIQKHDKGWFPQIQLAYYLTVGNCYLPEKEKRALSKLQEQDKDIFKPDLTRSPLSLKIHSLEVLGINNWLDPDQEFSSQSLAEWFEKITTPLMRFQIKLIFGFSIGEKDTAIAVVQRLLALLGLKLQYDRRERVNGKALRIYKGVNPNPDGRFEVFDRWLSRDSNKEVAAA